MRYVAFVHKEPNSAFGVSFPDFPGCISAGATADEALRSAVEALALHAAGMEADGEQVPHPRSLDEIEADGSLKDQRKGASFALVPLVRERGASVKVNLSLDAGLLEAIDAAARERGLTRSAFLASAARNEISG